MEEPVYCNSRAGVMLQKHALAGFDGVLGGPLLHNGNGLLRVGFCQEVQDSPPLFLFQNSHLMHSALHILPNVFTNFTASIILPPQW